MLQAPVPPKRKRGFVRFGGSVFWGRNKVTLRDLWLNKQEYDACRNKLASVLFYHGPTARRKLQPRTYPKANRTWRTGIGATRIVWRDGPELEIVRWAQRVQKCLGIKFHVDHTVPLSMGGADNYTNLRPIPAVWNLRKGNDPHYPLPECWKS